MSVPARPGSQIAPPSVAGANRDACVAATAAELNAGVTSALIGIQNQHLGRGPRTASTFHHGNVIVTLMHDVMTPLEKSLINSGNATAVTNTRHLIQQAMRSEFSSAITRLSGRDVIAFLSANHTDPDMATGGWSSVVLVRSAQEVAGGNRATQQVLGDLGGKWRDQFVAGGLSAHWRRASDERVAITALRQGPRFGSTARIARVCSS